MKKFSMLLVVFALLFLAACGGDSNEEEETTDANGNGDSNGSDTTEDSVLAQIQDSGSVTIGFANEAPYAYEEDGELKGAAVDIAIAVFAELGVDDVESQLADFSQLIPGVQAGQFDVITAGMAINPDRCENALFGEPEMQYGEGLVVQAGNPHDIHSYEDIADNPDLTVVVMEGATEIEFLKSEGVSEDQITTAADIPATFSAVQAGRADATTGTEMTVRMAFDSFDSDEIELLESFEQPNIEGVPSYGAAAFNLENEELRDAYNEVLEQLKEDGTVDELLEANGFSSESNSVSADVTTEQVCSGEIY